MKNIEIYKDDKIIVEIDGLFDAYVRAVIVKTIKLNKEQYKVLLEDTLDKLKDNRVKVLTIHTAKGLENKNVIVSGARLYNEEERKIAYVAATRAEQSLYWCPSICGRGKKNRPTNRNKADAGRVFEKASQKMISFG